MKTNPLLINFVCMYIYILFILMLFSLAKCPYKLILGYFEFSSWSSCISLEDCHHFLSSRSLSFPSGFRAQLLVLFTYPRNNGGHRYPDHPFGILHLRVKLHSKILRTLFSRQSQSLLASELLENTWNLVPALRRQDNHTFDFLKTVYSLSVSRISMTEFSSSFSD